MDYMSKSRVVKNNPYEHIAYQVNREDCNINYRVTWILMLNGFLFAALGFVFKDIAKKEPLFEYFVWAILLFGIAINIVGLLGVIGAHIQLKYLIGEWEKLKDRTLPRPFGKGTSFCLGAFPCFALPILLILVWLGFIVANIINNCHKCP